MRRILLLSLLVVLATDASAQRGGGIGHGFGRVGFSRSGLPQRRARAGGFGFNRGGAWFPYGPDYGAEYPSYYDATTAYGYAPPQMLYLQQPPPPPPREVHPVVIEYSQGAPSPSASADVERQIFGIVLKDGSTRSAIAVVGTADGVLHYVDKEERNARLSMNDVNREATLKLNRERKLNLWLPATPPSTAGSTPNR